MVEWGRGGGAAGVFWKRHSEARSDDVQRLQRGSGMPEQGIEARFLSKGQQWGLVAGLGFCSKSRWAWELGPRTGRADTGLGLAPGGSCLSLNRVVVKVPHPLCLEGCKCQ